MAIAAARTAASSRHGAGTQDRPTGKRPAHHEPAARFAKADQLDVGAATHYFQIAVERLTLDGVVDAQLAIALWDSRVLATMAADLHRTQVSALAQRSDLFDREYFAGVSSYGIYGEPRNFMTSLTYTY